jgi:hypothetical protein
MSQLPDDRILAAIADIVRAEMATESRRFAVSSIRSWRVRHVFPLVPCKYFAQLLDRAL